MKKTFFLLAIFVVALVHAQDYTQVIQNYLNNNRAPLGLTAQDVQEIEISSHTFSQSMQVENVYFTQKHQGIEVFNSTSSVAIKNSQIQYASFGFIANLSENVNTTSPSLNPATAISRAASHLGISAPINIELIETVGANSYVYSNGEISLNNIPVKLVYQSVEDTGRLNLAWDLSIYYLDASHYYSVRIDALTGELLDTMDWVTSCNFSDEAHAHANAASEQSILFKSTVQASSLVTAGGAQYRVFPIPTESPNHGPDALVSSPSDIVASPFGWHDTDGSSGAEYTFTRGNNVFVQEDRNGNNGSGNTAEGGAGLLFDFLHDFNSPPAVTEDAAMTNLFYLNNVMHDVYYQYGFDETSGNFQENNYGNGGNGNDKVNADAQDGSGQNNANFSTPPDGSSPRMQMFLWDPSGLVPLLTINNGPLTGPHVAEAANFGGPMPVSPGLTQDLVLVEDDNSGSSSDANDACDPITNGGALSGKIVVIRRGDCEFGFKGLAAQNEGAVAVIMVNNVPGDPISMGAGAQGAMVTIPMIMVSDITGEAIIAELGGSTVNGTIQEVALGQEIDGDYDNGVIAHEYGHGISQRLTGGRFNTGCLQNDEQMGEGWSDYFGLMLTIEPGDEGTDIRGIGTYDRGESPLGGGFREAPYSTDFAINDYTYGDTNNNVSQPHGIGFVWSSMLWEMTWDLIDQYGFDADVYNGTGGNNISIQLVMDGLKLQGCSPGFIDGRDAILMADELNNAGANRCLIWEAFARRGCGLSASQGSANSRTDQVEAFDIPSGPNCELGVNDEGGLGTNFIIYPNPSNGNINIKSILNVGDVNIQITDMNGRVVFNENRFLDDTVNIDAQNLSTGIYIVNIYGGNYVHTAKVIIR
jgi:extracellular elastinolytic metalloproteinase